MSHAWTAAPIVLAVALIAGCRSAAEENAVWLESPNGRITVSLDGSPSELGTATYTVELGGSEVLAESGLGITFDGLDMSRLVLIGEGVARTVEDRYELVGRADPLVGTAHERTAMVAGATGDRMAITFRVYDDAVALRYEVADRRPETRILEDHTEFAFAAPGKAWIQPHDLPGYAQPAYEAPYSNGVDIGHDAPVPSWNVPALFETGGRWVLLAEADAAPGDYGAHLRPTGGLTYQIAMPQPSEGMSTAPAGEPARFPWRSPWRVIVVAEDLAGIVETDAITHLAASSQLADVCWVRPGRVSWSWWSDHTSPRDPAALAEYVDLSAEFGWEYTLIDANWDEIPPLELERVIRRAHDAGVGVFLWYNSGGSNNEVTERPRDRMEDPERRKQEFAWLADLGVAGVKVDFFHSDRAEMIGRYLAIAGDAAEVGLMVNYHGSTVPRGWERTWPNIMTMEAVRGAEQYAFDPRYPDTAVWHNAILPFTRNVIGPMDYTPVTFSDQQFPHRTTNAHELALAVVYESPLQHFADSAESYRSLPAPVKRFLMTVPATWDETRFLAGYPGELAVVARRSGDRWFVGAIGGPSAQSVTVSFDFISGVASAELITDPGFRIEAAAVDPTTEWSVDIDVAGGFVILVDPVSADQR